MKRTTIEERTASQLNRVFFALSDNTRRTLLDRLYLRDGQRLGELVADFEISRQSISRHLEVLEEAGLIATKRQTGKPCTSSIEHQCVTRTGCGSRSTPAFRSGSTASEPDLRRRPPLRRPARSGGRPHRGPEVSRLTGGASAAQGRVHDNQSSTRRRS